MAWMMGVPIQHRYFDAKAWRDTTPYDPAFGFESPLAFSHCFFRLKPRNEP